jgi:L-ribulose-5-phosphate 3-epimerase UlaE
MKTNILKLRIKHRNMITNLILRDMTVTPDEINNTLFIIYKDISNLFDYNNVAEILKELGAKE